MYIRTQDKRCLINFDRFHEVSLDEENCQINAIYFNGETRVVVPLGGFKTLEEAKTEYEDILDSLLDDDIGIHEVD